MIKIRVFVLIVILGFSSCCKEKKPEKVNFSVEKQQINRVLDDWHLNAAETNFEAFFGAMTSESIFIGTDVTEVWNINEFKSFSKPHFDKGSAWNFKSVDRNVYLNSDGEFAWFDELLDTWMGVCRGSGVLKKVDNTWKIEHYVLSLTVPNDNIQEVIKVNKVSDSIYIKNLK